MATEYVSHLCSVCNKPVARRFCMGCKNYFCSKDFKQHEQHLSTKFDNEIVRSHDELLDKIQKLEYSNNLLRKSSQHQVQVFVSMHLYVSALNLNSVVLDAKYCTTYIQWCKFQIGPSEENGEVKTH